MPRYYLIINPTCNSGRGRRYFDTIISSFCSLGETQFHYTRGYEDATHACRRAIEQGFNVIVAVGGDGTINEVLNGFFYGEDQSSRVSLGVVHVGTSPDFNLYHNIPTDIEGAISVIGAGKTKKIDLGKIDFTDIKGDQVIRYFASNTNIGLGPLVANKANSRHRKYLGDFLGTLVATLGSLMRFKPVRISAKIDGDAAVILDNLINVTIGKDPYIASGMRVFNDIAPDDGILYMLSVQNKRLLPLLLRIPDLYIGNFLKYKGASLRYIRKIYIDSDKELQVEFDGDVRGRLPAKITVVPKIMDVIVP
jgi:YegS/Rv2252/BmrU family lipid kinase